MSATRRSQHLHAEARPAVDVASLCLVAALEYARRGWPVLPLHTPTAHGCSCGRSDCGSPSKHPRTPHGLHDASTDEATIRAWWVEWPRANVGVRTGAEAGVIVLDIDGPEGAATIESQPPLPPTPCTITGHGRHYWFRHPGNPVRNFTKRLPGLDLRGDGGYVVAPPSLHASGRRYRWETAPETVPLADAPAWVFAAAVAIAAAAPATATGGRDAAPPGGTEPILEGTRNDRLYRLGRGMHADGATHEAIAAALTIANETRCQPQLPASEVEEIAWNAAFQPDRPDFRARAAQDERASDATTERDRIVAGYNATRNAEVEDQW